MQSLDGHIVALTGAAGGIGRLVASLLREAGARVIGIDRAPCPAADESIEADLGSYEGIVAVTRQLEQRPIDTLVNLAGIQHFGPVDQQTQDNLWLGYTVNLVAPAMLTRALLPGMKSRGTGQIVNIGSVFGAIPFAHFVSYSSAKAGLKGFSDALRRELAGTPIAVTHIAPRAVRTPLNSDQVLAFAKVTKMNFDPPELVADRIMRAIIHRERNVVIGFPESLFVRINAIAPAIVDRALAANDRKAAEMFNWN